MTNDPVTDWLNQLKEEGKEEAAQRLWERYFEQLVRLAEKRLPMKTRRAFDGQDVAQSALLSFFEGMDKGKFPRLDDRNNLWGLLVVITCRKASAYLARANSQKAGGGKVRGESAFLPLGRDEPARGIEAMIGNEPTPELAAQMSEELDRLLGVLPKDQYRRIAVLRMEGCTVAEIVERMDLPRRTVENRLQLIRDLWIRHGAMNEPE